MKRKIVVGVTGASGAIYAIRFLEILKNLNIEIHLILTKSANISINYETEYSISDVKRMSDYVYSPSDIGACISSGSFQTDGMVILPCSMKSLSGIANGFEENLLIRTASVMMKEQKKLVLMVRETPLHAVHLENMLKLARCGVIINPAVPAFYNKPKNIEEIIDHSLARILDLFNFDSKLIKRWNGIKEN